MVGVEKMREVCPEIRDVAMLVERDHIGDGAVTCCSDDTESSAPASGEGTNVLTDLRMDVDILIDIQTFDLFV